MARRSGPLSIDAAERGPPGQALSEPATRQAARPPLIAVLVLGAGLFFGIRERSRKNRAWPDSSAWTAALSGVSPR